MKCILCPFVWNVYIPPKTSFLDQWFWGGPGRFRDTVVHFLLCWVDCSEGVVSVSFATKRNDTTVKRSDRGLASRQALVSCMTSPSVCHPPPQEVGGGRVTPTDVSPPPLMFPPKCNTAGNDFAFVTKNKSALLWLDWILDVRRGTFPTPNDWQITEACWNLYGLSFELPTVLSPSSSHFDLLRAGDTNSFVMKYFSNDEREKKIDIGVFGLNLFTPRSGKARFINSCVRGNRKDGAVAFLVLCTASLNATHYQDVIALKGKYIFRVENCLAFRWLNVMYAICMNPCTTLYHWYVQHCHQFCHEQQVF